MVPVMASVAATSQGSRVTSKGFLFSSVVLTHTCPTRATGSWPESGLASFLFFYLKKIFACVYLFFMCMVPSSRVFLLGVHMALALRPALQAESAEEMFKEPES